MIGDPSGRSTERALMDESVVARNAVGIRESLSTMFNFDDSATGAVVVNNLDFYANMTAVQLIRDVGRYPPPLACSRLDRSVNGTVSPSLPSMCLY